MLQYIIFKIQYYTLLTFSIPNSPYENMYLPSGHVYEHRKYRCICIF